MEHRDRGRIGLPPPDVPAKADAPGEKVPAVLVVNMQLSEILHFLRFIAHRCTGSLLPGALGTLVSE